ncbi:DUF3466 family protein [Vibrio sp. Isolate34]|uniref:DUF3466 family protein n=1 Tax=Vibrio sp. Isolate34 TaxID=2908540 RepID=UPI001EFD88F8|nr:DUF3466 family protein [Vibrio sp. Isolate34]MCG9641982.1 DUF3466 family protein [Vibrio sp. Isolate34]
MKLLKTVLAVSAMLSCHANATSITIEGYTEGQIFDVKNGVAVGRTYNQDHPFSFNAFRTDLKTEHTEYLEHNNDSWMNAVNDNGDAAGLVCNYIYSTCEPAVWRESGEVKVFAEDVLAATEEVKPHAAMESSGYAVSDINNNGLIVGETKYGGLNLPPIPDISIGWIYDINTNEVTILKDTNENIPYTSPNKISENNVVTGMYRHEIDLGQYLDFSQRPAIWDSEGNITKLSVPNPENLAAFGLTFANIITDNGKKVLGTLDYHTGTENPLQIVEWNLASNKMEVIDSPIRSMLVDEDANNILTMDKYDFSNYHLIKQNGKSVNISALISEFGYTTNNAEIAELFNNGKYLSIFVQDTDGTYKYPVFRIHN